MYPECKESCKVMDSAIQYPTLLAAFRLAH